MVTKTTRLNALARFRQPGSRSGFTMVEMLTVVALILIFATMVLASNQNVASQAYNVTFLQQEKELQNAVDMYYTSRSSVAAAAADFTGTANMGTILANAQGMMSFNSRDHFSIGSEGYIVTEASQRAGYGWSVTWPGVGGAGEYQQGPIVQEVNL